MRGWGFSHSIPGPQKLGTWGARAFRIIRMCNQPQIKSRRRVPFIVCLLVASLLHGEEDKQKCRPEATTCSYDGFAVNLTFSPKTKATLLGRKETVMVVAYFYGAPKKDTPRKYVDDMGEIWVGNNITVEVQPGETARFGEIKLDAHALERAYEHAPQLLINVFSGRRSSKKNLLSCDTYEGSLTAVVSKSINISCKLIEEEYGSQPK
jgi:hypothetical protein